MIHKLTLNIADLPEARIPLFLQRLEKFLRSQEATANGRLAVDVEPLTGDSDGGYNIYNNAPDLNHITGRTLGTE